MHASPGVLLGDAGDVRDLAERQLLDVPELERLAVGVGERRQSTRHLSVRERTIEVDDLVRGRHRRIDESSHAVEGARLAAPAVALVEADVRQDAVEPRSQVELAVEPGHGAVGPEERLLDGIFGRPRLAEAHHRVGIERRRVLVDDAHERVGIAPVVGFDQQSFVEGRHRHEANTPLLHNAVGHETRLQEDLRHPLGFHLSVGGRLPPNNLAGTLARGVGSPGVGKSRVARLVLRIAFPLAGPSAARRPLALRDRRARGPRQGRRRQRRRPSRRRARHPMGMAGRGPARRAGRGRGAAPGLAPPGRCLRRRDLTGSCRPRLGALADRSVPAHRHRGLRCPCGDGRQGGRPPLPDERDPRDRARPARRVGGPLRRRVHPLVGRRDTVADPARHWVCDRDRGTARPCSRSEVVSSRALLRSHLISSTAGRCTRRRSSTA